MKTSALGVIFSLCVLGLPASPALAKDTSTPSAKKQAQKKSRSEKASARKTASAAAAHGKRAHKALALHGKTRSGYQRITYTAGAAGAAAAAPVLSAGDIAGLHSTYDPLSLASNAALVIDQASAQVMFEKNADVALPIASLTKLMTAMVVVESKQDMEEVIEVTNEDIDHEKHTGSRLRIGAQMTRANMLHIALMSSENRAASALGRNYPGGLPAFVAAMNAKAKSLGMVNAHYFDSTGLSSRNVASARDLSKLVMAAYQHPIIREYSTDPKYAVETGFGGQTLQYINSNRLVSNPSWDIGLQKTGYITEAGHCLVMQSVIESRPVVMVFLDSKGKLSRIADAARIRKWIEAGKAQPLQAHARQS